MRKKLPSLKKLRAEADKLCTPVIKKLFPRCIICGNPTYLAHHFIPKSLSSRLRYEPDNLIPLCWHDHQKLHQTADPNYTDIIISLKGRNWYGELCKLRHVLVKTDRTFYEEAVKRLSKIVDVV